MFKFFKELVDSVKEGIAEGKAELAKEAADRQAAQQENNAAAAARLAASSRFENFAVALAAVYRQTFLGDLWEARNAQRSAVHLLCIDIPVNEVETWKKLLVRDFSVTNCEEANAAVAKIVDDLDPEDSDDDLAVWIGRAAHLATGTAAVGHVTPEEALDWLEPAVEFAIERYSGWDTYAQSFLAGERNAPGNNIAGRKLLAWAAEKLLEDELSPWKIVAWPARGSFTDLLASRGTAHAA